jgi:hypothetical protein
MEYWSVGSEMRETHYSTTPLLQYSNSRMPRSIGVLVKNSENPLLQYSNTPLLQLSVSAVASFDP